MADGGAVYSHEVARMVAEAARLADERVSVIQTADASVVQSDSTSAGEIAELLGGALALAQGDRTLMIARSDALALAMQFKTAEDVLDEILARDPDDFEARMRKDHWGEWSGVFTLPSWSDSATVLAPVMHDHISHGRSIQTVRAGVASAIAIVRPVRAGEMAPELSSASRSMWEPVWSQTPVGAMVAHYLLVEDDPASPYRAEGFLPLGGSEKASRMNGYWLLRQLAHASGCFVILADGDRVLYNRWFAFPLHVPSRLVAMAARLDAASLASGPSVFPQAVQWHMDHFDMDQVVFDRVLSDEAAGVAGFTG
jgi:hypothetical protein